MKVIGLTGAIGSGKNFVRDMITKNFESYQVSLSDAIHGEVEKKNGQFTREIMQKMGNNMRKKYGAHIFAKVSTEFMQRDRQIMVVDGIRNPAEAEWLKQAYKNNFLLVAVEAPQKIRFERVQKRGRDIDSNCLTWEQFVDIDEREHGKDEPEYGQHIEKCIEISDFKIENDGDEEKLKSQMEGLFSRIRE